MNFEDYTAIPAVNWSRLKLMGKSPKHYRDGYAAASTDSAARRLGRLVHLMVLEPDRVASAVAVWRGPGTRATKAYKEWAASVPDGVEEVTANEYDKASAIAASVRAHPVASVLLAHGMAEVTLSWTERVDDYAVPCKGRVDWLIRSATPEQAAILPGVQPGDPVLVDLKTCGSIAERALARDVARMMYHGQLAHYDAGLLAGGIECAAIVLINVETNDPHDTACDLLPRDAALYGGQLLRSALLARLVECERSGVWPGIAPELRTLELPAWAPGWEHDEDDDIIIIQEG